MPFYTKESLERLRDSIDIVDVIQQYVTLKRQGAVYKGLCPFHDERSPSFTVQPAQRSYHCFGCGVHGDVIQFLMQQAGFGFKEAVDTLSARFNVPLEEVANGEDEKGVLRKTLKEALDCASRFFTWMLLYTEEGALALEYLFSRGIDRDFIERFRLGYAPKSGALFMAFMRFYGFSDEVLEACGLITPQKSGGYRAFFQERITFAIQDPMGAVIGFSARSFTEKAFGGKYINTQETVLFKKSKVLFGIYQSRKRIAKTKHVCIVEGQLDALRMLSFGFDCVVAALGTAFGEGHVEMLSKYGVERAFLLFDSDAAGIQASIKVGNLLQKIGIEVFVVELPKGKDPDGVLLERGPSFLIERCAMAKEYLHFLVNELSKSMRLDSPSEKDKLIRKVKEIIHGWDSEILIHESMKKLAGLVQVPEQIVGVFAKSRPYAVQEHSFIKDTPSFKEKIDPNQILESDFLRWLIMCGPQNAQVVALCCKNIQKEELIFPLSREIYKYVVSALDKKEPIDLLHLVTEVHSNAQEIEPFITMILGRKVNTTQAVRLVTTTIHRIKERNRLLEQEKVKIGIQQALASGENQEELIRLFDQLKSAPPVILEGIEV